MNNHAELTATSSKLLLSYVADLELEVDRLRRQGEFLRSEVRDTLKKVQSLCVANEGAVDRAGVEAEISRLVAVLRDFRELPGYHPAHDQVIAIAVRPLIEQVFRWQQRLLHVAQVTLKLDLETEAIEWFPSRFRHILDSLFSNSLKYRDPDKQESWVQVEFRVGAEGYELKVSDNGMGVPQEEQQRLFDLFYRTAPARAAGLGIGLAIVKLLVEQSGGQITLTSKSGEGTTLRALLPRYDLDDYLSSDCVPQ